MTVIVRRAQIRLDVVQVFIVRIVRIQGIQHHLDGDSAVRLGPAVVVHGFQDQRDPIVPVPELDLLVPVVLRGLRPSGGSMSPVSLIRTIATIGPWRWSRHTVKRSGSPSSTEPTSATIQTVCRPVAVPTAETAALVPSALSTARTWNS